MKKLFTLLTLLVAIVTGAWGAEELTPSSSVTGASTNNADVVMTSYTIPSACNPGGGSTNSNWNSRWMKKIRTNQTVTINNESKSNCFYINVNSGYTVTGVSFYMTTNKGNESNTLIATYYDDVTKTSGLNTAIASVGAASPTQVSISGISATSRVVLQFSTNKQVLVYGTIYYTKNSTTTAEVPTFTPDGGDVNGGTTITLGGNATHTYYQWSDTEVPLTKDSEGWTEGKNVTVPNVTYTKYLYAYATNGDGLESSVISKAFNITKVKLSNGLAYATDAVTKKVGNAAFTNPLTNPNGLSVTYSIADGATATGTTVNAETGEVTLGETKGTATIKAVFVGNDEYQAGEATYTLTVTDPNKLVSGNAYYIGENETPVPDESIICNDITMTFVNGKDGEYFNAAVADNHINSINSNYNYSISGSSGNNGWKARFVPTVSGVLKVGVIINNNKTFSITNVTSFSYKGFNNKTEPDDVSETISGNSFKTGEETADKLYVEVTINAVAGTEYAFSVAGSKMGFYGFEFTPVVSGTITASGYNTYSTNYPVDLSTITGGTAYVATGVTDGKIVLEKCTSKVPAATGLFIAGTAGETFTISTTADETSAPATNLLVAMPNGGTVSKADEGKFNYVFGWTEVSNPGFYLINNTAATLGAFKAYLQTTDALSATSQARMGFLFVDELTGVNQIKKSTEILDGAIYNLSGQRVAQPTKGLYIVNGKKYINQ